jgi:hypothetical protein
MRECNATAELRFGERKSKSCRKEDVEVTMALFSTYFASCVDLALR